MRRVVITGMGIVSSIGNNVQEVTSSLHDAKSGIVKADKYAELGFRCQVHGAPHYDLDTIDRRVRRFMPINIAVTAIWLLCSLSLVINHPVINPMVMGLWLLMSAYFLGICIWRTALEWFDASRHP